MQLGGSHTSGLPPVLWVALRLKRKKARRKNAAEVKPLPLNLPYYYGHAGEQYAFFRIPKLLLTDDRFAEVSTDAKLLYGLLLDRMELSYRNGWIDEQDRVFIIFTAEEVMSTLRCRSEKAARLFAELDGVKGIGLIERKRQGLGRPTLIYVKNFSGA